MACLGVNSSKDQQFEGVRRQQQVMDGAELYFYQYSHQPFYQMPTEEEAKEGFLQCFEHMIRQYQSLLLIQISHTHMSFGFHQDGQQGEVFKILLILQKKPVSINVIAQINEQNYQSSGYILLGQVLDKQLVPRFAIINQGKYSEVKIGVANMMYDMNNNNDELKIFLKSEELKTDPFKDQYVPIDQMTVDIYMSELQYGETINYGVPDGNPDEIDPTRIWKHAYSDRIPKTLKPISLSFAQALGERNLTKIVLTVQSGIAKSNLIQRLQNGGRAPVQSAAELAAQATHSVQSTINSMPFMSSIQPKKTRAQELREQKAQEIKERSTQPPLNTAIPMGQAQTTSFFQPSFQTQKSQCFSSNINQPLQPTSSNIGQGLNKMNTMPRNGGVSFGIPPFAQQQQFGNQVQSQSTGSFQTTQQQSQLKFQPISNVNQQQQQQKPDFALKFTGFNPNQQQQQQLPQQQQQQQQQQHNQPNQQQQPLPFQSLVKPLSPAPVIAIPNQQFNLQSQQQTQKINPAPAFQFNPTQNQSAGQQQNVQFQFNPVQNQNNSAAPQQQPSFVQLPQQQFQPLTALPALPQQQFIQPNQPPSPPLLLLTFQNELLKQYGNEMMATLTSDEIQGLYNLYQTNQSSFNHFIQRAHDRFKEQEQSMQNCSKSSQNNISIVQPPVYWASKFKRDILCKCDIGLYVLRLQETVNKIDDQKYSEIFEKYVVSYSQNQLNGLADQISLQLLKELVMDNVNIPKNDMMVLYQEHLTAMHNNESREAQRCDLIIKLGNQKFYCHSVVFKLASPFFQKEINKMEQGKRGFDPKDTISRYKLQMPEWMNQQALKLLIKFLYLGHLKPSSSSQTKPSFETLFDLLILAYFVQHPYLPFQLIFDAQIDQMSLRWSMYVLKNTLKQLKKNLKNIEVLQCPSLRLLYDYSLFYLAVHLPQQLRLSRQEIQDSLSTKTISEVLQLSITYIKGPDSENRDLNLLITFAYEIFGEGSVYNLMHSLNKKYLHCQSFDQQIVPKLKLWMKTNDPKIPYDCNLIQTPQTESEMEQNKPSSAPQSKVERKLLGSERPEQEQTFIMGESSREEVSMPQNSIYEPINIKKWAPKYNYRADKYGRPYTNDQKSKDGKIIQFQESWNLSTLRKSAKNSQDGKGTTYISKSFDCARRCWHFKLDFEKNENLSLWLVERGVASNNENYSQNVLAPNFSSVFLDFEIKCQTIGTQQVSIFYSFAHNTYQIIGVKNIINLSEALDSEELEVKVYINEYSLHSAVLHYITDNFAKMFKRDQNEHAYSRGRRVARNIYSIPFTTIYQILKSNALRVQDENYLLGFLFHYTNNLGEVYDKATVNFISNLLTQALRYNYLCLSKILSAIRRNEWLRTSKIFHTNLKIELSFRVQSLSQENAQTELLLSSLDSQIKDNKNKDDTPDIYRKHYDLSKIKTQGRNKQENGVTKGNIGLLEEVVTWAITATVNTDIQKSQSKMFRNNRALSNNDRLLQEEDQRLWADRKRKEELLREQQREQQHRAQFQQVKSSEQNEIFRLKQELEEIKLKQQSDRIIQKKDESAIPKFLRRVDKENISPIKKNETFEESPPMKCPNDTHAAAQKISKERMSSDFSRILKQINLSPVAKNGNNRSFQLNTLPIMNIQNQQEQPSYQARTRIPTQTQRENEKGNGCNIF